jgi:tetratricopeptide (TPR) repeat protein
MLAPEHPQHAADLLNELEEQAELLADEDPGDGVGTAGAIQLWQAVISVAPDGADRLHDRALERVTAMWQDAPTLAKVSAVAAAASFVAQSRPVQAEQLVAAACRYLERVLHADAGRISAAAAFHVEFGFQHTLNVLFQALADVGTPPETATRISDLGCRVLAAKPEDHPEQPAFGQDEEQAFTEATRLADHAYHLASHGAADEAEHHLEQALALLPAAGPGKDRSPLWLPDLAGALIHTAAVADPQRLLRLAQHPVDRTRVHAALALAYADCSQPAAARHHAQEASRAASFTDPSDRSWPYAAQALACAGEVEFAVDLIEQHQHPDSPGGRAAWRKADRAARIAVAAELTAHAPETAGELILPLMKRLDAARSAIQSQGLLTALVELLPAITHLPLQEQRFFDAIMEEAREQAARSSPQSWRPEDVLIQAFLRIGDGKDPNRQMVWLERDMANRGTRHFPIAALAVLHAAVYDSTAAQRIALLPAAPHHRAVALTAVASHLAGIPCRPCPEPNPFGTDPFVRTVRYLALKTTKATHSAHQDAIQTLHHALTAAGWIHTIPALAHLAPESILAIRDITLTHLHPPRNPQAH